MRPFEGRIDEADLVALRELVPSATAPLRLAGNVPGDAGDRTITLCTMLPEAAAALVRENGEILVAMQRMAPSLDAGADLARAIVAALAAEPGRPVEVPIDGEAPALTELLDPAHLEITVHPGFTWWLPTPDGDQAPDPDVSAVLERANATVVPTVRLTGVDAAYWCAIGDRRHLRWPLPYDEEPLLDALARLQAGDELTVGDGSRYAGYFRADGLVAPVWDLAPDADAASCEEPAAELAAKLAKSVDDRSPLSAAERRARAGVVARSLTLR
jgi:hypothetical protein